MAKRGYKLQEFVAHSANVNCIKIGKKGRRHFITGGDDEIVNLWSIGTATCITSLTGHTSPIESVAFDSTEVLVAAGASSGVVKLWDLEETKVVRTLNGHRSYCTALEFHPFGGEFLASGSMDTNLKIWDIRKKGCIHTYKGHKRAISTIKFTPDGRWVVSGGLDNVVKIWDLTAGKLLHEFKLHEGHIKSMDFHPLEFLLATGSSDRTVKFWDLETFELIGTTRPEETGVRSITFHPDGRTLFCGLDNSLKVYSWEPIICHDAVDIGWSTLGDLCVNDGKLLGCSYFQNSIGVWAADISHIEPYAHSMSSMDPKTDLQENAVERVQTPRKSFIPPDDDTKDIKNIYVDTAGVTLTPVVSRKDGSFKPSNTKLDIEKLSASVESVLKTGSDTVTAVNVQRKLFTDDVAIDSSSPRKDNRDLTPVKYVSGVAVVNGRTRSLVEKFEKKEKIDTGECQKPSTDDNNMAVTTVEQQPVNVVPVEVPEAATSPVPVPVSEAKLSPVTVNTSPNMLREKTKVSPMQKRVGVASRVISEKIRSPSMAVTRRSRDVSQFIPERTRTRTSPLPAVPRHVSIEKAKCSPLLEDNPQTTGRVLTSKNDDVTEDLMQDHELFLSTLQSRVTKLQVVRNFWERKDTRGAINALQKLPDHAVQADVISVMLENMESLNLDLFSCLLPLLLGLLDSQTERHINVSLEMLLKLVAVFGPVITFTISAPPTVGVDLHAEKRLECCNQCHVELQKIQKTLPNVIRRGGLAARSAHELNLILQKS
ncbi:hypothetical protein L2E82_15114 [Cichorium intybus]|uniref:Uncharacterized protein n=1 Tax=Cichorium intybus TaxID=13427 RepID=A0ACB9F1J1_CICIN|nr:hypothetical protein L2E82_15114 [Cichorium intybus]